MDESFLADLKDYVEEILKEQTKEDPIEGDIAALDSLMLEISVLNQTSSTRTEVGDKTSEDIVDPITEALENLIELQRVSCIFTYNITEA